jgi:hypothetical protein
VRRLRQLWAADGIRPGTVQNRLPIWLGYQGPQGAAALDAGARALGTDALRADHLATTIVAPGRNGPFVAAPVGIAASGDSALCRVELRDGGRGERLVATTTVRVSRIG